MHFNTNTKNTFSAITCCTKATASVTNITSGATITVATAIVSASLLPQLLLLIHITTGANATTLSRAVSYYNRC